MTATIVSSRPSNSISTTTTKSLINSIKNVTTINNKTSNNVTASQITTPLLHLTSYSIITPPSVKTTTTTIPTLTPISTSVPDTTTVITSSLNLSSSHSSMYLTPSSTPLTRMFSSSSLLSPTSSTSSSSSSTSTSTSSSSTLVWNVNTATAAGLPPISPKNDNSSIFQQRLSQLSSSSSTSLSSSSSSTASATSLTTTRPTTSAAPSPPRQVTTIPVHASRTTATIITSNKRPTIIIYPTVSPESIVIPIVSCILGFPLLALMVICCLRRRAKLARERDRRRNYDMQDHAVSLVRFSPIHRLNNRSSRAISLRPERSLSRGFPSLELDTVIEERSDQEQTQTDILSPESPLDPNKFRDFNSS